MRTFALLISGLLATVLAGCESSDTTVAACKVTDVATGEVTEFWTSDYGSSSEAVAACGAYGLAVNGSGEGTTAPDDDDGSAADVEDGDPESGATTNSIVADGEILEWITNDGVRVCLSKSRVFFDVNPDDASTVGYGWGGQADWSETGFHDVDQYRYDGKLYACPISAMTQMDMNGVWVQNVTRLGSSGPNDYTNWGAIFNGDRFACVSGETSDGAPTYALAYTVHSDGNGGWRVDDVSQGTCESVL